MLNATVFYINPMSYNNLSAYDSSLLSNLKVSGGTYFCSKNFERTDPPGFDIKRLYNYNKYSQPLKTLSYIYSQCKLLYYLIKMKPKLIHLQWIKIPIIDLFFLHMFKQYNKTIKIILTVHNILPHDSGMKQFRAYNSVYSLSDMLIVHHQSTKETMVSMFNIADDRIKIIKHGHLNISKGNNIEPKRKNDPTKFVFGFLGVISEYKGIDILIDTWLENSEQFERNKYELIIAGEGHIPKKGIIQQLNSVKIINKYLNEHEFMYYLHSCDSIILPYINISQSGLLMTAINNSIPTIISQAGGLSEPFQYGNIGVIMKELSSHGLKEAMISMREKYNSFNNSEFSKVKEAYSWETISLEYDVLYRTICTSL